MFFLSVGNPERFYRTFKDIASIAFIGFVWCDPDSVIDRATFEAPTTPSAGIPHVLVNGTFVVRDSELVTDTFPGRLIYGDYKKPAQ